MKTNTSTYHIILTITVGFLLLYILINEIWLLWTALIIGGLSVVSIYIAKGIAWSWMQLGAVLGMIIPKIILTLIYFGLLFPIALLSRCFGKKDVMQLKKPKGSLFKTVDRTFAPDSFEKPW